ncbi:MAG: AlpA family phage regulatory protein [Opitutae bacterium]|jgi:prophage regulatory protein
MQTDTQPTQSIGFYRLPTVLTKIPVSRSAWWQGIKDGRYPAGIKIAPRTTAWLQSDIEDLCARLKQGGK